MPLFIDRGNADYKKSELAKMVVTLELLQVFNHMGYFDKICIYIKIENGAGRAP